jgi:hypothetical protein
MSYRIRWTVLMTMLGVVTAVVVFAWTDSVGWAIVGLVAAGVVANAMASGRAGARPRG